MEKATLEDKVKNIPYWYHRIDLPHGITTPGWAPHEPKLYGVPDDLTGLRVLDIGAWDGYWSFEALKRGAREVVAIDDFSDNLDPAMNVTRTAWDSFDLCRSAMGISPAICQREELSIYELNPARLGVFDVIFFFGTLYHLRYPQLALDKIAQMCTGQLYIESAICDDFSPYQGGLGKGYHGPHMVMEFYPGKEYGDNPTNWWCPTLYCLMQMTRAAGFEEVEGWKLSENPPEPTFCRGFVRADK